MAVPLSPSQFRSQTYWADFFALCAGSPFEWYGTHEDVLPFILKTFERKGISSGDRILEMGCGNSSLAPRLSEQGFSSVSCIDNCVSVIEEMNERMEKAQISNGPQFLVMDMLDTEFERESFSAVLDKAALDSLAAEDTKEVEEEVRRMFEEIARLLKPGGCYISITLAEDHIFKKIMTFFGDAARCSEWSCRIKSFEPKDRSKFQPFFFIFEKLATGSDDGDNLKLSLPQCKLSTKLSLASTDLIGEKIVEARKNYAARSAEILSSSIRLHIICLKPWDDETDPKDMIDEISQVEIDGVKWGKHKILMGEFGIRVVHLECRISLSTLDIADIIDVLEGEIELVQSIDSVPFSATEWS